MFKSAPALKSIAWVKFIFPRADISIVRFVIVLVSTVVKSVVVPLNIAAKIIAMLLKPLFAVLFAWSVQLTLQLNAVTPTFVREKFCDMFLVIEAFEILNTLFVKKVQFVIVLLSLTL